MDSEIKIVLDACGGDNAPDEIIKGAYEALKKKDNLHIIFAGPEEEIRQKAEAYPDMPTDRVSYCNATEVIEMAEPPVKAIMHKKDSSIVKGMNLVKNGEADGFISAGSTGAVLVGGQLIIGKAKGVKRAPLAPVIPTMNGASLLIDCGANVDARPEHLVSFAKMGSIYMENVLKKKNPTVGLLSIGTEEEKGNALVKQTLPLLKECSGINFIGPVEARDLPFGVADVVVTEAFAGNIALKMYEGTAKMLMSVLKESLTANFRSKIGAAMALPSLKRHMKAFDVSRYGGAPLLGLKGLVVKAHGSSKAVEIKNTIFQCMAFSKEDIIGKIAAEMNKEEQ
ncbi:MAG: phosphate acyltransferase PlsX [Lachnospiraceae bacterium]|uniref:Phosphate acyltransferase n=1 Tax=Candidatus Weimeria bifida TaxID=2599074 RepID=A0A6N7IXP0_9FIRM|nr:phosphate acyltransferase PlsX [Candidatus Weimeria bifida]RRF95796.1 MAG: phosphate acyltransferase PlsX [Lachnospiraceae bacterium]